MHTQPPAIPNGSFMVDCKLRKCLLQQLPAEFALSVTLKRVQELTEVSANIQHILDQHKRFVWHLNTLKLLNSKHELNTQMKLNFINELDKFYSLPSLHNILGNELSSLKQKHWNWPAWQLEVYNPTDTVSLCCSCCALAQCITSIHSSIILQGWLRCTDFIRCTAQYKDNLGKCRKKLNSSQKQTVSAKARKLHSFLISPMF